jgi:hypothetical protein
MLSSLLSWRKKTTKMKSWRRTLYCWAISYRHFGASWCLQSSTPAVSHPIRLEHSAIPA